VQSAYTFTKATDGFYMEHSLLDPSHNQESGHATTARQAAEALFTPKQERLSPSQEAENAVVRKPRILAALPPAPPTDMPAAISPTIETRRAISKSEIDRIRTWLKYGMTIRQAANACSVSVSELKDALRSRRVR